jgi:hypothetical protein
VPPTHARPPLAPTRRRPLHHPHRQRIQSTRRPTHRPRRRQCRDAQRIPGGRSRRMDDDRLTGPERPRSPGGPAPHWIRHRRGQRSARRKIGAPPSQPFDLSEVGVGARWGLGGHPWTHTAKRPAVPHVSVSRGGRSCLRHLGQAPPALAAPAPRVAARTAAAARATRTPPGDRQVQPPPQRPRAGTGPGTPPSPPAPPGCSVSRRLIAYPIKPRTCRCPAASTRDRMRSCVRTCRGRLRSRIRRARCAAGRTSHCARRDEIDERRRSADGALVILT